MKKLVIPLLVVFLSPFLANAFQVAPSKAGASSSVVAQKRVIVVGGGPVGLATALTLSQAPHHCQVTVLESASQASTYEPSRAFQYLINTRGQEWTNKFPAVQQRLVEQGSASVGRGSFSIVPADPTKPVSDPSPSPSIGTTPSYWVPRNRMIKLLEEVIQEVQEKNVGAGSIQVIPNQKCIGLTELPSGQVKVIVQDQTDSKIEQSYEGDLIVGADGINSAIRSSLADKDTTASWLTINHKKFRVKQWKSPSTNLCLKVLQFPPGFEIPSDGKLIKTQSEVFYFIKSVNTGPRDFLYLGVLPIKDSSMARPTTFALRPNHDMWKLKTGNEVREWFQKAFPRLDFDELVPQSEWDRFVEARRTNFPKCQYSPGLQVCHPSGNHGVVLVGDALHAFPPDMGQGINSGLGDVVALDRALRGKDVLTGTKDCKQSPSNLKDALSEYERVRGPEVRGLIRLVRFGAPYQYQQPLYKDRVGRFLWTANFMMRLLLNKLTGGIFPPPAAVQARDGRNTFRKIMRRADIGTKFLWICFGAIMWKMFLGGLFGKFLP